MPETYGGNLFDFVQGSTYLNNGSISANSSYQRSNNFFRLPPGYYEIKLLTVGYSTAQQSAIRVIGYNDDESFDKLVYFEYTVPLTETGSILKYKFYNDADRLVRFSFRSSALLQFLEIEKL